MQNDEKVFEKQRLSIQNPTQSRDEAKKSKIDPRGNVENRLYFGKALRKESRIFAQKSHETAEKKKGAPSMAPRNCKAAAFGLLVRHKL